MKYLHGTRRFTPARFAMREGENASAVLVMSILVFRARPIDSTTLGPV